MGKYETWNEYVRKYNKENVKNISFKVNKKTDADIIEYLNKSSNKSALIKKLLREDMQK